MLLPVSRVVCTTQILKMHTYYLFTLSKAIKKSRLTSSLTVTLFCIIYSISINTLKAQTPPFTVKTGLFDPTQPNNLGLTRAPGTETVTVFSPSDSTDHYSNGVVMTAFKGWLYCQWQSSAQDEDAPDTWVAYSRSSDGKNWSTPMVLAASPSDGTATSGGWWVYGDTLVAYINTWPSSLSPRGGFTYYTTSTNGQTWSDLKPLRMKDGSTMNAVIEQDPHAFPDSSRIIGAAHFQPGLIASPIYTDDPSGMRGWVRASYTNLPYTGNVSRELEPSWFWRNNGGDIMIFRDQSGTYLKLASLSLDHGQTWSTAVLTDMPDSRAKQSAGNLPDSTAYMVNNPVDNKTRIPLAVTLSADGNIFDTAFVLRQGGNDLQPQRYSGKSKTLGYNYPKSMVWQGYLYAAYATNKEDVQYTRIPLTSISLNNPCGDGFTDACSRCVGGSSGKTACNHADEAEDVACSYDGVLESKNAGFKGTGYINGTNATGAQITFMINASSAGNKNLSFRYANGSTNDRTATIAINGTTQITNLSFPSTGAFTHYQTIDLSVHLNSGNNSLKQIANTPEGLANIDQIGYVSSGVSSGSCVITGIVTDPPKNTNPYPNPTQGKVFIHNVQEWTLLNAEGMELLRGQGSVVDLENFPNGLYFLKSGWELTKVIKE